MSDADRLHAAADRLDGSAEEFTAVTTRANPPPPCCGPWPTRAATLNGSVANVGRSPVPLCLWNGRPR